MSIESLLRIELRLAGGRVVGQRIAAHRTDAARLLLQGRTRLEIGASLPLMFTTCGLSHAVASSLACAAAAGETPGAETLAHYSAAVASESVRESAWHMLVDWPAWLGEHPSAGAFEAARGALAFWIDAWSGRGPGAVAEAMAVATLGMSAPEWLAMASLDDVDRWMDDGRTATARMLHRLCAGDAAAPRPYDSHDVAFLNGHGHAKWIVELARAMDADLEFPRHPTWRGAPAETGALARRHLEAPARHLLRRSHSRLPARFFAQLHELALLLGGREAPAVGALALPSAGGIAWVENLRGLLVHQVRWVDGAAATYRIVGAPDWNFHPDGAFVSALREARAQDAVALKALALRMAGSLDPCVVCEVTVEER